MDELSPEDAARILGYHPQHVYRLLALGRIKAEKRRNLWWIPREEIERLKRLKEESGGRIRWE